MSPSRPEQSPFLMAPLSKSPQTAKEVCSFLRVKLYTESPSYVSLLEYKLGSAWVGSLLKYRLVLASLGACFHAIPERNQTQRCPVASVNYIRILTAAITTRREFYPLGGLQTLRVEVAIAHATIP